MAAHTSASPSCIFLPALLYITLVSFSDSPHLYLRHSRCSVICRRSKRLSVSGSFVRRSHPYGRSRIDRCLFYVTCCLVLTAIWKFLQPTFTLGSFYPMHVCCTWVSYFSPSH